MTANQKGLGIPRYKAWAGMVLFAQGFRPFFFGAGISAVLLLALWLMMLHGTIVLPLHIAPSVWHGHEMIFGSVTAAIAGFLLTAVPNWTGRMPLQGWPLIGLFVLWFMGRIAMATGDLLGAYLTSAIDSAFLIVLLAAIVREILKGRNWRNLPIALALGLLASANVVGHLETLELITSEGIGNRFGVAVITVLITIIGGRIIPSFTGNWLAKQKDRRRPQSFNRFDRGVVLLTVASLGLWVVMPESTATGFSLICAGVGNFIRLARWCGHRALREPLVWSLHVGFAWLPLGLIMLGGAVFWSELSATAGLHALTAGAMGGMILAVMTRATLGHTGCDLTADRSTTIIYVLGILAACTRVSTPYLTEVLNGALILSGLLWCTAFGVFSIFYGRRLLKR